MSEVDEIAKAKSDLIANGQTFTTQCDAYRIVNLAALRNGWKMVQKSSGDNCQGRKVDGLIKDGGVFDGLVNAGPPLNANVPSWQYLGPQGALVAVDPLPDPLYDNPDPGPGPDPNPPSGDLEERVTKLEEQMDYVINLLQEVVDSEYAVVLPIQRIPKTGEKSDE